jgi:hypothetical protein
MDMTLSLDEQFPALWRVAVPLKHWNYSPDNKVHITEDFCPPLNFG